MSGGLPVANDNSNPYLKILREDRAERESALRISLGEGVKANPDTAARANMLAEKHGLPPTVAEGNLPELEQREKAQRIDYGAISRKYPTLTDFLTNPENAKIAHDDIGTLTHIADYARSLAGDSVTTLASGLRGAGAGVDAAAYKMRQGAEKVLPAGMVSALDSEVPGSAYVLSTMDKGLKEGKQLGEQMLPPKERRSWGTEFTGALGQVATNILMTVVNPALATAHMFGQGVDQQDERMAGKNVSPETVANARLLGGAVTAATERIEAGVLLKGIPGLGQIIDKLPAAIQSKWLKVPVQLGAAGIAEGSQEVIEGLLHDVVEYYAYNPDVKFLQDARKEFEVSGAAGVVMRGLIMAMGHARRSVTQEKIGAEAEQLKQAAVVAQESKLQQRAPEKFREYVKSLGEGQFYVSPEAGVTFYQSLDEEGRAKLDAAMPDFAARVEEAKATGADIEVSHDEYLAHIATLPQGETLAEHMKRQPDGFTMQEFHDLAPAFEDDLQAASEAETIEKKVYDQIVNTGMTPDAARKQAQKFREAYQALSERVGENPEMQKIVDEAFFGLTIQGESPIDVRKFDDLDLFIGEAKAAYRQKNADRRKSDMFGDKGKKKEAATPRPLVAWLAQKGGIDPSSPVAAELQHLGIDVKRLYKAGGRRDLDNIVASEFNGDFSDREVVAGEDGNGYIDRQWLLDALRNESHGQWFQTAQEREAEARKGQYDELYNFLGMRGLDLQTATKKEIRDALEGKDPEDAPAEPTDEQRGIDRQTQAKVEALEKPAKEFQQEKPPEAAVEAFKAEVQDFGEKIEGARKDLWKNYKNSLTEALPDNAADITLAKHFPQPDYDALIAEGADIRVLAAIKAMRDEIPSKPQKSYLLKRWADTVGQLRKFSMDLLDGVHDIEYVLGKMQGVHALSGIADRVQLYSELGYPDFLKAKDSEISEGMVSMHRGKEFETPKRMFTVTKSGRWLESFEDRAEAVEYLRKALAVEGTQERTTKLDIYQVTKTGEIIIGKKVGSGKFLDLKGGFTSAKDARAYLKENEKALLVLLEKKKEVRPERRSTNDPRRGEDYRLGEDVTPEKFAAEFGFRGVQFGNYVEQAKRVKDLNNAYDALLDLSGLLGVPSRAISLNGTLGLSFGARGQGGKDAPAAHYEPDMTVINLTKRGGAGSLGHEWWHALDNNIGKRQKGRKYLSENPNIRKVPTADNKLVDEDTVRPEVVAAFKDVMTAIKQSGLVKRSVELDKRKAKDYWSTDIELSARAFEAYLIKKAAEKGLSNDYLANILSEEAHAILDEASKEFGGSPEPFPYPTAQELETIAPAFDKLFATLKTRETEKGVEFYQGTRPPAGIEKLIAEARRAGNEKTEHLIGTASEWLIAEAAAKKGLALEGYVHTVDNFAIRHVLNEHGAVEQERARGQVAITEGDLKGIPQLLAAPDHVVWNMKTATGREAIGYLKKMDDGSTLYLEEVRSPKRATKRLAAVSMRKYVATMSAEKIFKTLDPYARDDSDSLIISKVPEKSSAIDINAVDQLEKTLEQDGKRGQVTFYPSGRAVIKLFKDKNMSTLLHESGHFYWNVMEKLAAAPNAPEQVVRDVAVVRKWVKAEDGKPLTVPQEEKIARGFEAYLLEGKAPSIELRGAFRSFKAWMLNVYKRFLTAAGGDAGKALDAPLTDEVRQVFDRLLATDEQIERARKNPVFQPDPAIMEMLTVSEQEKYVKKAAAAHDLAREELFQRLLRQETRKQTAQWKAAWNEIDEAQRDILQKSNLYRAIFAVTKGTTPAGEKLDKRLTMDKKAAEQLVGKEVAKQLPSGSLDKLGVPPVVVADMFNLGSPSEMLYKMAQADPFEKAVKKATTEEMRARFGDMMNDGTIEREALEVMHNELQADQIETELHAVQGKVADVKYRTPRTAYENIAGQMVDNTAIKKIVPYRYYRAEVKAASQASKAVEAGVWKMAADEKKKQLLNHYMFRISKERLADIDKRIEKWSRLGRRDEDVSKTQDIDYIYAARFILSKYGIGKAEGFEQWQQQLEREDPDKLRELQDMTQLATMGAKDYREMTVFEFEEMADAVDEIVQKAKTSKEVMVGDKKMQLDEYAGEVYKALHNEYGGRARVLTPSRESKPVAEFIDDILQASMQANTVIEKLDEGKANGIIDRGLRQWLRDGETKCALMEKEANEKFLAILNKHYGKKKIGDYTVTQENLTSKAEAVYIRDINRSLTREEIISVALNWGNADSRAKVVRGRPELVSAFAGEEGITPILRKMRKQDWAFVQDVWDYIDSYWYDIQDLEKRTKGSLPKKVEAMPFTAINDDGEVFELQGGYFPLKYDPDLSIKTAEDTFAEEFKAFAVGRNAVASTRRGHTKERVAGVNRPVRLDGLNVIREHVSQVIRDLTMREAIQNTHKILNHKAVKAAFEETMGPQGHRFFDIWLKDTAIGKIVFDRGLGTKAAKARHSMTVAAMGWKVSTALVQFTGFTQSMVELRPKWALAGFKRTVQLGLEAPGYVQEKSEFMRARGITFNRDVGDAMKRLEQNGVLKDIQSTFMIPLLKMQQVVDTVTWLGAYEKALHENRDGVDPVKFADLSVENAQGSGAFSAMSPILRGTLGSNTRLSETVKLWTVLMSYFNTKANLAMRRWNKTNLKKPEEVATLAGDFVMLFWVETVIGDLILGRLPDVSDDDEPVEAMVKYSLKAFLSTAAAGFPVFREISATMAGYGVKPPAVKGIEETVDAARNVGKVVMAPFGGEDVNWYKVAKSIVDAGVYFSPVKYPAGQINTIISAMEEQAEGGDVSPADYLVKPPHKK
jgi:hypothetical protein